MAKKHGGPNRGQGRKPLPVDKRKIKHQPYLSPGPSEWLKKEAETRKVPEGVVLDDLITEKTTYEDKS